MKVESEKKDREFLSPFERSIEFAVVGGLLLMFGYLVYHQAEDTGFFTDEFKIVEMICLYVPIFVSLTAPLTRAIRGCRNPARPFDAAGNLLLGLGSLWLLIVFPFEFSHLADPLPEAIRPALSWVNNDIGKIPLVIQIIVGPLSAVSIMWKYFVVRHNESATLSHQQTW